MNFCTQGPFRLRPALVHYSGKSAAKLLLTLIAIGTHSLKINLIKLFKIKYFTDFKEECPGNNLSNETEPKLNWKLNVHLVPLLK